MNRLSKDDEHEFTRRSFLRTTSAGVAGALVLDFGRPVDTGAFGLPLRFEPTSLLGSCTRVEGATVIPAATWYEAQRENDGLVYRFEPGILAGMRFLTADIFADSPDLPVFQLRLREGEDGPTFTLLYAILPYAEARMRMRAEAINQNQWQFLREGAFLKPMAGGSRVDLSKVDRMHLVVLRKGPNPVRWSQTAITAALEEPTKLKAPRVPNALLDQLGQSDTRVWPSKTRSVEELKTRLNAQLAAASSHKWPEAFSEWGGLATRVEKPAKRKRQFPYRKVEDLEADIAAAEGELRQLEEALASPDLYRDGERVKETTRSFEETKARLHQLYEHWEEAVELN